ncbi:hypothetical protein GGI35DRAFT_157726 [Trichoderma velutinum]
MDVDTPSEQGITAATHQPKTGIREGKYQDLVQRRKELRKVVNDLPDQFQDLSVDIRNLGSDIECGIQIIETEHPPMQERYNNALEAFHDRWNGAKRIFEERDYGIQRPFKERAATLYNPVEAFITELKTLQGAFEAEINHPEQVFKNELNSVRIRLERFKETGYELKIEFDELVERLENACKRVDELEKLTEQ